MFQDYYEYFILLFISITIILICSKDVIIAEWYLFKIDRIYDKIYNKQKEMALYLIQMESNLDDSELYNDCFDLRNEIDDLIENYQILIKNLEKHCDLERLDLTEENFDLDTIEHINKLLRSGLADCLRKIM